MKINIDSLKVGPLETNCYLLQDEQQQVIIVDPGDQANKISTFIEKNNWQPLAIFNTHGHYDHIGAVNQLVERYNIPVYLNDQDLTLKTEMIRFFEIDDFTTNNQKVLDLLAKRNFQVLSTPGHSQGSVCLYNDKYFICGDTIFAGGFLGRTDLSGGDYSALANSVRKIFTTIGTDLIVLPGHGPKSSIFQEKIYHGC